MADSPTPTLLLALDALVAAAGGSRNLSGTLSIGVRTGEGDRWWRVELGPEPETALLDERPQQSNCWVLLGENEARAIVESGHLPDMIELLDVRGDPKLFEGFVALYARSTNVLGIRSGQGGI